MNKQYLLIQTDIEQYQSTTSSNTKVLGIFDNQDAKADAERALLKLCRNHYLRLSDLNAVFIVWDDEDISDEESRFYALNALSDDFSYEKELMERGSLIYRWDNGLCEIFTTILQIVSLDTASILFSDEDH